MTVPILTFTFQASSLCHATGVLSVRSRVPHVDVRAGGNGGLDSSGGGRLFPKCLTRRACRSIDTGPG